MLMAHTLLAALLAGPAPQAADNATGPVVKVQAQDTGALVVGSFAPFRSIRPQERPAYRLSQSRPPAETQRFLPDSAGSERTMPQRFATPGVAHRTPTRRLDIYPMLGVFR